MSAAIESNLEQRLAAIEQRLNDHDRRLKQDQEDRHQLLEILRQAFLMLVRYLDKRLNYSHVKRRKRESRI